MTDIFKFFIGIKKNYHINNKFRDILALALNKEKHPLKDDLYRLQKYISKDSVEKLKDAFACLLHHKKFVKITLTYIDGHVIPYFGLKQTQKLKHQTRNKLMRAIECFNASAANGDPFYFLLDVNKQGLRKSIIKIAKKLINLFGKESIKVIIYDKGGNSDEVCDKLNEFGIYFITLTPANKHIDREIIKEVGDDNFVDYSGDFNLTKNKKVKTKKVAQAFLELRKPKENGKVSTIERCGILLLEENDENLKRGIRNKHVLRTNIPEWIMPNIIDLFDIYSRHWCQEQMHAETKNDLGLDCLPKNFKGKVPNRELINRKERLQKKIKKNDVNILELKKQVGFMDNKIHEFRRSIREDNKLQNKTRELLINTRLEEDLRKYELEKEIGKLKEDNCFLTKQIEKIVDNPTYYELREESAEYYILMKYIVVFINSFVTRLFTPDNAKLQMKRSVDMIYQQQGNIWLDEEFYNVELCGLRTDTQVESFCKLCEFFNSKHIEFAGKTLRFHIYKGSKNTKDKNSIYGSM